MKKDKAFKNIFYCLLLLSPFVLGLILFFIIIFDKSLRYQSEPSLYFLILLLLTAFLFVLVVFLSKRKKLSSSDTFIIRVSRWYCNLNIWTVLLILIFCLLLYIFTVKGGRLGSDGYFYYSYLHSIYFDNDLNFSNEYEHFGLFRFPYLRRKTQTELYQNVFSVGPAILWSPFYLIAHGAVYFNNLFGASIEADGYSYPYFTAITLGSLIYGFLGLLLLFLILKRYFAPSISFLSITTLLFGSFLVWYMIYEPSMSHALSFFVASLFLFLWLRNREKRNYKSWLLLAFSGGLMVAVRWQNAVFLLLPAVESLLNSISLLRKKDYQTLKKLILYITVLLLLILLLFIPQMIVWKTVYGKFLTIPQQSKVLWHRPMVWDMLFSSRHGLLSWTPFVYLSFFGFIPFFKKDKRLILQLLAVLIIMIYLNSIIYDWWAGWAFGNRRFASCLPIFALGFASLLEYFLRRPKILLVAFIGALTCWNLLFMMQYKRNEVSPSQPISFEEVAQRQIERIYKRIGYPFSFPANFLFSIKYGVPLSRYDILVGRYYNQPSIDIGKDDGIYIGRGWSYSQVEMQNISFRWSDNWESTILIPLGIIPDYELILHMRPYRTEGLPRQVVEVWVNDKFLRRIALKDGYAIYSIAAPSNYWKQRINELKFRYRYIASPAETVGSEDARRLGIALDYVKMRIIK